MESPVYVQPDASSVKEYAQSNCEKSFSTTLDFGGQFAAQGAESLRFLDARAAANLVRLRLLTQRKENTGKQTHSSPYDPSSKCAIQIRRRTPRGGTLCCGYPFGANAALASEAATPALLQKGA